MKTCRVEYFSCDFGHEYHFQASRPFIDQLKELFKQQGIELEMKEIPQYEWSPAYRDPHNQESIIRSLFEVQGIKYPGEGCSISGAVESLIEKYVALKETVK